MMAKSLLFVSLIFNLIFVTRYYLAPTAAPEPGFVAEPRIDVRRAPQISRTEAELTATESTSDENVKTGAKSKSDGCESFWLALKAVKFDSDVAVLPKIPSGKNCTDVPEKLAFLHNDYIERCENPRRSSFHITDAGGATDPAAIECRFSIRTYLSNLVAFETRNMRVSDISDPKILNQKLRAAIDPGIGQPIEPDVIIETAHRLLELDPRNLEAAKQVLYGVTNVTDAEQFRRRTDLWEKAEWALQRAESLKPNDPEIEEYGLWVKTKGLLPDLVRVEARKHIEQHKDSGLGYYYLAGVEWNAHNEELARKYLSEALRIEPRERRFRQSSQQAERGELPYFDYGSFNMLNFDALASAE